MNIKQSNRTDQIKTDLLPFLILPQQLVIQKIGIRKVFLNVDKLSKRQKKSKYRVSTSPCIHS